MLDRSIAPDFVVPNKFDIPAVTQKVFSNGVTCNYISAGDQPIIKLELHFAGGKLLDKGSFNSFFVAKLLTQGTKNKTSEQIAEEIAFRGAHLELISGNEKLIITVYTITKHLEPVCALVSEIITQSAFREDDIERVCNLEIQNLEINETKTSFIAAKNFKDQLFPSHYYGNTLTQQDVKSINKEGLVEYYSKYVQHSKYEIFVSGKVDDSILENLENAFGTQNLHVSQIAKSIEINNSVDGLVKIEKEEAVQASIKYGFQTIGKTHPDYFTLSVCNEILGGYFGSRLMSNIREDKGYTYGIGSYIIQVKHASFFQISTDVKGENADDTIKEIEIEIAKMQTELISEEELNRVRNYIFGSFASSLNTPFDLMEKFKTIHSLGLEYSFYSQYFEALNKVTPQDILEISKKYLSTKPVITICG